MLDERVGVFGGSYSHATEASERVQFRRALTLTFMTLVMPGSAQLVMGSRRVGRIAIRMWLASLLGGGFVLFLALTSRSGLFTLLTDERVLTVGRWLLIAGAVCWVALMLDAWRLGRPMQLRRKHRLWMTGVNGVLCFSTAGAMLFAAHMVAVQSGFIGTVFASDTVSGPESGRYNVLLLGGDSGPDRNGLRPDSLTVASIDAETGRTVLVGLPRNLENVPFPRGSVMAKEFPRGFDCEGCTLNGVNTWANDHASLFGTKRPGVEATMGAVEEITGLDLNYYAMVNLRGFSKLVDAVGGVTIDVKERTAIGGIGAPIRGWIPKGEQKLNGTQTLWYARSRVQNDDWSRMGRQKCVMNAMLHQLSPRAVLMNVEKIAESSKSLLTTDIPAQQLGTFMDLALKARSQKVSTVSLVPPVIFTGNPDIDKVRRLVDKAIGKAEGTAASGGILDARLSLPDTAQEKKDPRKANQTEDLDALC
jgi:polyisoprenyl-teichoic acid--peptidoglycan teichoic acid transferase